MASKLKEQYILAGKQLIDRSGGAAAFSREHPQILADRTKKERISKISVWRWRGIALNQLFLHRKVFSVIIKEQKYARKKVNQNLGKLKALDFAKAHFRQVELRSGDIVLGVPEYDLRILCVEKFGPYGRAYAYHLRKLVESGDLIKLLTVYDIKGAKRPGNVFIEGVSK